MGSIIEINFKLQRENGTFQSARVYFDSVLKSYQKLQNRLHPDARIEQNPLFEAEMFKIQEHQKELID